MFRKLVSNISFSPALVGQLSFYARRLQKEESTRRVGLIFTALALVVQSFAVFSPPEAANAASGNDMIRGGITSKQELLTNYDRNINSLNDFYTSLGITRAELAATKESSINSKKTPVYSYGMFSRFSAAQGEGKYTIKNSTGNTVNYYYRPLRLSDTKSYTIANGSTYKYLEGYSKKFGWFGVLHICGNFVSKKVPTPPKCPEGTTGTYPNCKTPEKKCPIPGKTHLPIDDENCKETPVASCKMLSINRLGESYQLNATSAASNGAKVTGYKYVIKRDGTVIETKTSNSTELTDSITYRPNEPGSYRVELTVKTTAGEKTGNDCVKSFTVAPPEKCEFNPDLEVDDPECQPCAGDPSIWVKDEKCAGEILKTKLAKNTSQGGKDATISGAKASDRITYTLRVENTGNDAIKADFEEKLDDVAEYATIIETGGGTYDKQTKLLTWPTVTLAPGESQSRMFTVQLASTIPAAPRGSSDRTSYDCRMINTFGNAVEIDVNCPAPKVVEQTVTELPETGPAENMIFAGIVFSIVAYFYARSRQLKTEVRLIRRGVNAGTI